MTRQHRLLNKEHVPHSATRVIVVKKKGKKKNIKKSTTKNKIHTLSALQEMSLLPVFRHGRLLHQIFLPAILATTTVPKGMC